MATDTEKLHCRKNHKNLHIQKGQLKITSSAIQRNITSGKIISYSEHRTDAHSHKQSRTQCFSLRPPYTLCQYTHNVLNTMLHALTDLDMFTFAHEPFLFFCQPTIPHFVIGKSRDSTTSHPLVLMSVRSASHHMTLHDQWNSRVTSIPVAF